MLNKWRHEQKNREEVHFKSYGSLKKAIVMVHYIESLRVSYSQFKTLAMFGTVPKTWHTSFYLISIGWVLEFPFYIWQSLSNNLIVALYLHRVAEFKTQYLNSHSCVISHYSALIPSLAAPRMRKEWIT